MIKKFLNNVFFRKHQAANTTPVNPEFISTHNSHSKSDFEVTELSYDEYVEYAGPERRVNSAQVDADRRRSH
ncbi:MAG: hypothetical protein Q7U33_04145 [Methylotenera sp.]|uniref:hypothetical protein n=1 Tax=Methylotenera sp. TaxID=2051956 RepID=UPI002724B4E5|nr:hypothetical protein [Methylotenera sp.]MDO9150550.1 hypothetical protein [Methylotenera sp.]